MIQTNCNKKELASSINKPDSYGKLFECKEPRKAANLCDKGFSFGNSILCWEKQEPKTEGITHAD